MKKTIGTVKTVIGAIALLLLFTTTAMAQKQNKAGEGAIAVTTKMKEQLDLNGTQYNKVLQINKEYLESIIKSQKTEKSFAARDKKIKEYSAGREKKLKSVLTDAQYRTYAAGRADNQKLLQEYYEKK